MSLEEVKKVFFQYPKGWIEWGLKNLWQEVYETFDGYTTSHYEYPKLLDFINVIRVNNGLSKLNKINLISRDRFEEKDNFLEEIKRIRKMA